MANRVLIGKNTNSNLGFSGGSPGYGLWISEDGVNVESATEAQLLYRTDIADSTSGVISANGAVAGVKYRGYTAVTTDGGGTLSSTVIKSWPKTDFTVSGTVYTPLCLAQMGKTAGAASRQWAGGWHASTGGGIQAGMFYFVVNDHSNTHSALLCSMPASGLSNTTHRIYYAICYPAI
jgi:hypothetical protein